MNYNYCLFVGNAGRAPEIRTTTDGMIVTSFSLAVSTWNKEREGKGEPIWLRIVAFGKLAETVEKFVKKGHWSGFHSHQTPLTILLLAFYLFVAPVLPFYCSLFSYFQHPTRYASKYYAWTKC